jgi:excisionase family DNA binding protein
VAKDRLADSPEQFTGESPMSPVKPAASASALSSATLTVREVAALLKVSRATVCRMDASGRLPRPLRFGRSFRWNHWEMLEWIDLGAPRREKWEDMRKDRNDS